MEILFEKIVTFFAVAITLLFGHAGLWSLVVSLVSAIVTVIVFIIVFFIALPFARTHRLGRWPRRIAKAVLVFQAFFASLVVAGIVAGVCEIKWSVDPVYSLLVPWIMSFILFVWWIVRLGKRKDTEQKVEQVFSESALSEKPLT